MILHVLITLVAGWLQRHQQHIITYLMEENRVLKAHHDSRLRLPDTERRLLAALAHPLGRKRLQEIATLARKVKIFNRSCSQELNYGGISHPSCSGLSSAP